MPTGSAMYIWKASSHDMPVRLLHDETDDLEATIGVDELLAGGIPCVAAGLIGLSHHRDTLLQGGHSVIEGGAERPAALREKAGPRIIKHNRLYEILYSENMSGHQTDPEGRAGLTGAPDVWDRICSGVASPDAAMAGMPSPKMSGSSSERGVERVASPVSTQAAMKTAEETTFVFDPTPMTVDEASKSPNVPLGFSVV